MLKAFAHQPTGKVLCAGAPVSVVQNSQNPDLTRDWVMGGIWSELEDPGTTPFNLTFGEDFSAALGHVCSLGKAVTIPTTSSITASGLCRSDSRGHEYYLSYR